MKFNEAQAWRFVERLTTEVTGKEGDEAAGEFFRSFIETPEHIEKSWIPVTKCIQRTDGYLISFERTEESKLQQWDITLNISTGEGSYRWKEHSLRGAGKIHDIGISSPNLSLSKLFTSYFKFDSEGAFVGRREGYREMWTFQLGVLRPTPESD